MFASRCCSPRRGRSRADAAAVPALRPPPCDPAAAYITAGQDEPGYRSWYLAAPWRRGAGQVVQRLSDDLRRSAGIVPTWQLLRTATSWQDCGGQPFEIPPTDEWPHIVQTLRYVRDYVDPGGRPGRAGLGLSQPGAQRCAGGAPESAHKHYSAIDMVPLRPITREAMMRTLCGAHSQHGAAYQRGPRLLRLHALPRRQHQVSAAGTWTRRSPPNARRSSIAKIWRPSGSHARAAPGPAPAPAPTIATAPAPPPQASTTPQPQQH